MLLQYPRLIVFERMNCKGKYFAKNKCSFDQSSHRQLVFLPILFPLRESRYITGTYFRLFEFALEKSTQRMSNGREREFKKISLFFYDLLRLFKYLLSTDKQTFHPQDSTNIVEYPVD